MKVIHLAGQGNSGKTSIMWQVVDEVFQKYKITRVSTFYFIIETDPNNASFLVCNINKSWQNTHSTDFQCIAIDILCNNNESVRLGIASAGDYDDTVKENFNFFISCGCQICVIVTRDVGTSTYITLDNLLGNLVSSREKIIMPKKIHGRSRNLAEKIKMKIQLHRHKILSMIDAFIANSCNSKQEM